MLHVGLQGKFRPEVRRELCKVHTMHNVQLPHRELLCHRGVEVVRRKDPPMFVICPPLHTFVTVDLIHIAILTPN